METQQGLALWTACGRDHERRRRLAAAFAPVAGEECVMVATILAGLTGMLLGAGLVIGEAVRRASAPPAAPVSPTPPVPAVDPVTAARLAASVESHGHLALALGVASELSDALIDVLASLTLGEPVPASELEKATATLNRAAMAAQTIAEERAACR